MVVLHIVESVTIHQMYTVAQNLGQVQVFNLDLTLIHRFSTSPHTPWPITISSNQLYVGTTGGIILVYQNEKIINQFIGVVVIC